MQAAKIWNCVASRSCWLLLAVVIAWPFGASAVLEQTFDVLQIGTHTYKNVTVTTKARDYVFILHSAGMASFKTKDLSPQVLQQLGYDLQASRDEKSGGTWVKRAHTQLCKLRMPKLGLLAEDLRGLSGPRGGMVALITPQKLMVAAGAGILLYLFFCYCCALICQKAGEPAGALVWIPVVQLVPLLRAARMSGWWMVAFLVPLLNVLAHIVWSIKIVHARAKNAWLALLLILPVTNLLAFLYLAFSEEAPKEEKRVVQIMTLDAA